MAQVCCSNGRLEEDYQLYWSRAQPLPVLDVSISEGLPHSYNDVSLSQVAFCAVVLHVRFFHDGRVHKTVEYNQVLSQSLIFIC